MLQTLKTGTICQEIQITLAGQALRTFVPSDEIDGLYKADGNLNGSPSWKNTESGLLLFWDPKKESSRGDDRSHWKVGTIINNAKIGYIDTYDTSHNDTIYAFPTHPGYLWSYFTYKYYGPFCTRCWGAHWEPAKGSIRVKCVCHEPAGCQPA